MAGLISEKAPQNFIDMTKLKLRRKLTNHVMDMFHNFIPHNKSYGIAQICMHPDLAKAMQLEIPKTGPIYNGSTPVSIPGYYTVWVEINNSIFLKFRVD